MDRVEFLNKIYEARTRLEAALAHWDAITMTEPDLPNQWSIKDLLAHLGWWERNGIEVYQALKEGRTPEVPANEVEINEKNDQIITDFRARSLEAVRGYERQAFVDLVNLVETAPEADLFDPQRFAWTRGRPLAVFIGWDSFDHYAEHLPDLEKSALVRQAALETGPGGGVTVVEEIPEEVSILQRAGLFLRDHGRDIDRAIFDHHFGKIPLEELLAVLARYQNLDGGFSGLEVDIQAPQSNPFATELALVALCWMDAPRDHPILQHTLAYLEETQDEEGNLAFTPEIYQHELAPWFKGWKWPNINPSCSIAGLLKQLGIGSNRFHTRAQNLFDRLAKPEDLIGSEYYNVRPYAYYLQTEWTFPEADFYRSGVVWWLTRQHLTNPALDATHFMDFVPTPKSAIASRLPASVLNAQLDRLITEQSADGGWPTPYDPRWRGWITVNNLLILRAHGRI